ncbi:pyrin and HIN domain-containing protein 1-like isoform X2 [Octodon degus]|uniref:Pyrin and HIN domain-containing protein 1-like isoform X2 n=1 Tax=Octodon degus TaxID=10160 RepID=A0A6P6D689_OCTDE|nr:pyrin and HIN domain-containing protein 1-like isoform X2 [Octodon degus]
MADSFKEIVLLGGLHRMSDYNFRIVKSLLSEELNLKGREHAQYDRISFTDLMVEKFKNDAGLEKLITICKKIPDLESTADHLRKEKAKLLNKKSQSHNESATGQNILTMDEDLQLESEMDMPMSNKPKMKHVPYEPSEENGYQTECKEIVVLKVTEPFIYDVKEPQKVIIHATVATEEEFFRVKIFDMAFKDMFIPKNVLSISHYVGQDGFLEISNISTVSFIRAEQGWNISSTLVQRANATPKIEHILSLSEGKHVNGSFTVLKKTVRGECIFYEIQDNTGKMEVMVCGRLASIYCEEGDKLYLTGFAVSSSEGGCQLRSVLHSHLRVIKPQKSNDETTQP